MNDPIDVFYVLADRNPPPQALGAPTASGLEQDKNVELAKFFVAAHAEQHIVNTALRTAANGLSNVRVAKRVESASAQHPSHRVVNHDG
jgi:hypothetical protein